MYKNKTYLYYILAYVRCQYDVNTPVYFKSNSRGFSLKTESTRINCCFTTQIWYDIKKEKIYRVYNQMPAAYISLYLSTSDGSRGDPARCILWGWGGVNPRGTLSPQSYWPRAPRTDVGTTNNDVKQTRAFWRWRVRPFLWRSGSGKWQRHLFRSREINWYTLSIRKIMLREREQIKYDRVWKLNYKCTFLIEYFEECNTCTDCI